jgi:hypothetical protein
MIVRDKHNKYNDTLSTLVDPNIPKVGARKHHQSSDSGMGWTIWVSTPGMGKEFLLFKPFTPTLAPTQHPVFNWYQGYFPRDKGARHEVCTKVKNEWSYAFMVCIGAPLPFFFMFVIAYLV